MAISELNLEPIALRKPKPFQVFEELTDLSSAGRSILTLRFQHVPHQHGHTVAVLRFL